MDNDPNAKRCSARVYSGHHAFRSSSCSNKATVVREVKRIVHPDPIRTYNEETFTFEVVEQEPRETFEMKWFCGTHDPIRIAEREDKKRREYDQATAARNKRYDNLTYVTQRLGCGRPEVDRQRGVTGAIVIYAYDAEKIIDVLKAAQDVASGVVPDAMRHLQNALNARASK